MEAKLKGHELEIKRAEKTRQARLQQYRELLADEIPGLSTEGLAKFEAIDDAKWWIKVEHITNVFGLEKYLGK